MKCMRSGKSAMRCIVTPHQAVVQHFGRRSQGRSAGFAQDLRRSFCKKDLGRCKEVVRAQNTGVPPRAHSSLQLRREQALQTAYQAFCKRIFASKYRRTNVEHSRRLVLCYAHACARHVKSRQARSRKKTATSDEERRGPCRTFASKYLRKEEQRVKWMRSGKSAM